MGELSGRYRVLPVKGDSERHAVFDVIMGDAIAVCPDEVAAEKVLEALTRPDQPSIRGIESIKAALKPQDEPQIALCTWDVGGPWWQRRARKLENLLEQALAALRPDLGNYIPS